jgi:hypothetical protein
VKAQSAECKVEEAFCIAKSKKMKKGIDKREKKGYNNQADYATGVRKVRGDVLKRPKRRPC